MRDLVAWLRAESAIHPVLVAGLAQYQLVHIHLFLDGNRRTSRLLSTLCLYRVGYDFKRLFTLSEYYDRDLTPHGPDGLFTSTQVDELMAVLAQVKSAAVAA